MSFLHTICSSDSLFFDNGIISENPIPCKCNIFLKNICLHTFYFYQTYIISRKNGRFFTKNPPPVITSSPVPRCFPSLEILTLPYSSSWQRRSLETAPIRPLNCIPADRLLCLFRDKYTPTPPSAPSRKSSARQASTGYSPPGMSSAP